MIENYKEYKEYIDADRKANKLPNRCFALSHSWRYLKCLRKVEFFYSLSKRNRFFLILLAFYKYRLYRLSLHTGITLPANTFGKGLYLPHHGSIVVHHTARFGSNCVLQNGVNISEGVVGGDHLYIGAGSKIMTDVKIASDVIIGANAVVTRSIEEPNIVVGGIPARKISNNGYKNRTKV